jgi:uncharacterized cupredoxin-like copper-binding protein
MSLALLLAETSKTPFYIAAGVLVLWAILLAALGLARGSFGADRGTSTAVMAVSVVLVVCAMGAAVATAEKPKGKGKAELKPIEGNPVGSSSQPDQNPGGGASGGGASAGGGSSSSGGGASSGGGGTSAASGAPTGTVKLAADPSALAFDTKSLTAKAGSVTIDFKNPAPIPHDVKIEQGSKELGGTKEITNSSTSAKVTLKPGTYTFFCSVPGHRQAGMEGTLTVK